MANPFCGHLNGRLRPDRTIRKEQDIIGDSAPPGGAVFASKDGKQADGGTFRPCHPDGETLAIKSNKWSNTKAVREAV